MTPELQSALTAELQRQGATAIDDDVLRCILPDDTDALDHAAIKQLAEEAIKEHPALFTVEKRWDEEDDSGFRAREAKFRAGLRKSRAPIPNGEFAELDAAALDPETWTVLDRYMSGKGGSWERAVLQRALKKQRATSTGGNDAA